MGKKRVKIGLVYAPTENWIGGAYYVQNIAKSLLTIHDEYLPIIKLFCSSDKDFEEFKNATRYPYMERRLFESYSDNRFLNSIIWRYKRYINKNYGTPTQYPLPSDDVLFVYPFSGISDSMYLKEKCLGWIPDFQEKYLTELFSGEEMENRNKAQKSFIDYNVPVVFSSNDARKDFFKFHPESKDVKTYVLQFATSLPDFSDENISELKNKFGITKQYLFCANQFWAHKNHLFLFHEFKNMLQRGLDVELVCTGALTDYRDEGHIEQIRELLRDDLLGNYIKILGFIPRTEMLCIMKHAIAVIQPSLFEGWSTVVEDAKAMNQFVFLSDLPVHREQMHQNVCFFNPRKNGDLVERFFETNIQKMSFDYEQDRKKFAQTFVNIIDEYKNKKFQ